MKNEITVQDLLELPGEFLWAFNKNWFVKTSVGNFHWSDSDYPGGDNSLRKYFGSEQDFLEEVGCPYFRDKGETFLKNRIPETVKLFV